MGHDRNWIGIDVGKSSHHACAVDETGAVCWSVKIANTQEAADRRGPSTSSSGPKTARTPTL
nr:IS110 family transposase [Rhodococcus qingshengii]